MLDGEVFSHQGHKVVLECSFDDLMQQVQGDKFVDVGAQKIVCKRLQMQLM